MAGSFCTSCGKKISELDVFCAFCGKKRMVNDSENKENDKPLLTLMDFQTKKTEERTNRFKRKTDLSAAGAAKKPKLFSKKCAESVLINVGIIRENEKDGELSIVRGSKLPVLVPKQADCKTVHKIAVEKHSNHDQFFCGLDGWTLLYPDQKEVDVIPGTAIPFTVEKYKKELAKPYSKIDLYLCKTLNRLKHELAKTYDDDYGEFDPDLFLANAFSESFEPPRCETDSVSTQASSTYNLLPETNLIMPADVVSDSLNASPTTVKSNVQTVVESSKQSTCSGKNFEVSCGFCPICNKRVPFAIIEEHADECLKRKETTMIYSLIEPDDDIIYNEKYEELEDGKKPVVDFKEDIPLLIKKCDIVNEEVLISVRRQNAFEDFTRFFGKRWNWKSWNKIYKISFIGEPAVDIGGVSREFYSEALKSIKQKYFIGDISSGFEPSCGILSVSDGTMKSIGHLFAASIVNGRPAPSFFAPWIYEYIVKGLSGAIKAGPKIDEASNLKDIYDKIHDVKTDTEISALLSTDEGLDALEAIGYRGNPRKTSLENKESILESIVIKAKVEPLLPIMEEICNGLCCYNILDLIKRNPEVMRPVFVNNGNFLWTYTDFVKSLKPQFSEEGGNKKPLEITTYKALLDVVEYCFNDECPELSPEELIQFITGSPSIPVLGLHHHINVAFVHGCKPYRLDSSSPFKECGCLPTVSTCDLILNLPVHIKVEDDMKNALTMAVKDGFCFGKL